MSEPSCGARRFVAALQRGTLLSVTVLLGQGCGGWWSAAGPAPTPPPAAPIPADAEAIAGAIRFLEDRVRRDPDDFIALNKLGGYYLQRLRETGDLNFLELAGRTARASLAAMPEVQNPSGLGLRAQVAFAAHDFAGARDCATRLTRLRPGESFPQQMLGDALLELGDYDAAAGAYRRAERTGGRTAFVAARLGRLAALRGEDEAARRDYSEALALALALVPASRETVAWCRWQLGEAAFNAGDYPAAEGHYRDSLTTFPDYYRALGGLGRARAARGDLQGAIEAYERAARQLPDPAFVAALGDLYQIAGREAEAARQFQLCEQMARLAAAGGAPYNRQLALFYADHDLQPEEAYRLAREEYAARRDIYGADALAWTALKAGRGVEARQAMREALRLGTRDARLLYHAGMIANAAGDLAAARDLLRRALALSPQFDPRHAPIARRALGD